ncbi:16653_t:CDS:2 [Funneliformis caledonium]|uniref:16653_t:CDS:1 n=1 Tax=Funneliformis caledonium TaxID=1117310 RepID=A0A9N9N7I0_9GLOM|nr:16653_t:CDS:2 [Funneliformis caledonium]
MEYANSRSSQVAMIKRTIGINYRQENMPFTADAIIKNPLAISSLFGVLGSEVDATALSIET